MSTLFSGQADQIEFSLRLYVFMVTAPRIHDKLINMLMLSGVVGKVSAV